MNRKQIIGGIVVAALASVFVYAVLALVTDGPEMIAALRAFPMSTLLIMLALGAVSFVIRGIRWGALMRVVGHPVSAKDAVYLQISGQTMSVTPGRVGEVLKPWLATTMSDMPLSKGIALVFSERLADLIAVCILSLGGLTAIGGKSWVLLVALAVIGVGTWVVSSQWFHSYALLFLERQQRAKKHHVSARAISETIQDSLTWRTMLWSIPASMLAWGLEGVGFALCLQALGFSEMGLFAAVSIYAVSTIVGAFTFLPGGIGLTEASMAGILIAAGMASADASAATLITRIATLWWGVGLGWLVMMSRPATFVRLMKVRLSEDEPDASAGADSTDEVGAGTVAAEPAEVDEGAEPTRQ